MRRLLHGIDFRGMVERRFRAATFKEPTNQIGKLPLDTIFAPNKASKTSAAAIETGTDTKDPARMK